MNFMLVEIFRLMPKFSGFHTVWVVFDNSGARHLNSFTSTSCLTAFQSFRSTVLNLNTF